MSKSPLSLDISKFILKIQSLKDTQTDKLNKLLSDTANNIYDTYEYICDLDDDRSEIKKISDKEAESMLKDLNKILKQSDQLTRLLDSINFDNDYTDKMQHQIDTFEEIIPNLIKALNKKLKAK